MKYDYSSRFGKSELQSCVISSSEGRDTMNWYHLLADNDKFFTSLGNIAVFVQALFFILSIYFIWRQLRETRRQVQENTDLTRAANTQKLVELSSPFNLMLIQNRDVVGLWLQGDSQFDTMDPTDKERYYNLLMWWLILHQNIYHQWKKGLMDKDTYDNWTRDLKYFLTTKNTTRFMNMWRDIFETSFVKHIDELIVESKKQQA
jgi:hypothetical protein